MGCTDQCGLGVTKCASHGARVRSPQFADAGTDERALGGVEGGRAMVRPAAAVSTACSSAEYADRRIRQKCRCARQSSARTATCVRRTGLQGYGSAPAAPCCSIPSKGGRARCARPGAAGRSVSTRCVPPCTVMTLTRHGRLHCVATGGAPQAPPPTHSAPATMDTPGGRPRYKLATLLGLVCAQRPSREGGLPRSHTAHAGHVRRRVRRARLVNGGRLRAIAQDAGLRDCRRPERTQQHHRRHKRAVQHLPRRRGVSRRRGRPSQLCRSMMPTARRPPAGGEPAGRRARHAAPPRSTCEPAAPGRAQTRPPLPPAGRHARRRERAGDKGTPRPATASGRCAGRPCPRRRTCRTAPPSTARSQAGGVSSA